MDLSAITAKKTAYYLALEEAHGAHNYHPLPVVLEKGEGIYVWDVEEKRYMDFLSGYSAVNHGHCHPRLVEVMMEQVKTLTLTSRAFHSKCLSEYERMVTRFFDFDKVLPMNTGVEAVETAIKLCRKWAYNVKGIEQGKAKIIVCEGNFHGRTSTVISFSSDPTARNGFGPYMPGFVSIPFDDLDALAAALQDPDVAGFLVEPIQGEAGVIVPQKGFLAGARKLCSDANVLLMFDEIQTGLGRTGKVLCCYHEKVDADILILGKALGGGMLPVSAVLANDPIMLNIRPGEHGSTFGGNPLACRLAMIALDVLIEEELTQNAESMGQLFRKSLEDLRSPHIKIIRGMGLLNAIVIDHAETDAAWNLCIEMMKNGLLAKPTHGDKIRFAPPLTIKPQQIVDAVEIIRKSLIILD